MIVYGIKIKSINFSNKCVDITKLNRKSYIKVVVWQIKKNY